MPRDERSERPRSERSQGQPGQRSNARPEQAHRRRERPRGVDVDALLAHARDPRVDLLAEAEAEADKTITEKHETVDLTDREALRRLLHRHGIWPNKGF